MESENNSGFTVTRTSTGVFIGLPEGNFPEPHYEIQGYWGLPKADIRFSEIPYPEYLTRRSEIEKTPTGESPWKDRAIRDSLIELNIIGLGNVGPYANFNKG